ncbi:MAG: hypothetical protein HC936_03255, partial [Leptolyngbyaceae cyanobacterium SU_3_3]|nr:hypothetical protein [Leptolyngbyaceae cyanobacterium SU_3_3]
MSQLPLLNMTSPLHLLGIPPNAWLVDETTADLTRPPLRPQSIVSRPKPRSCGSTER